MTNGHGTRRVRSVEAGFALAETLIATLLLAGCLVSIAQLFVMAARANWGARSITFATVLAAQKMEQIWSLAWGYDLGGLPLTDTTSDLTRVPETPTGGNGLAPSPSDALDANTPGFVDYLDGQGKWVGTGVAVAPGAVYIRRWSIEPLPTGPNNTLVLQVSVTRFQTRGAAEAGWLGPGPEEARVVGLKTRKST